MDRNTYLIMAGVSVVSLAVGGAGGYYIATRKLREQYNSTMRADIAEMRDYYQRRYKEGDYATPEETAAKLIPAESVSPEPEEDSDTALAAKILMGYSPTPDGEEDAKSDEEVARIQENHEVKMKNIFQHGVRQEPWDHELEMQTRAAEPNRPYILTQDEYMENDSEFEQSTITYYQGDDVLCDSIDQEIPDSDGTVGDINLTKFGHGSGDPNVLYIRNERLEMEFEVLLSRGSYVKEVLGFFEAPERQTPRKFRPGRDE